MSPSQRPTTARGVARRTERRLTKIICEKWGLASLNDLLGPRTPKNDPMTFTITYGLVVELERLAAQGSLRWARTLLNWVIDRRVKERLERHKMKVDPVLMVQDVEKAMALALLQRERKKAAKQQDSRGGVPATGNVGPNPAGPTTGPAPALAGPKRKPKTLLERMRAAAAAAAAAAPIRVQKPESAQLLAVRKRLAAFRKQRAEIAIEERQKEKEVERIREELRRKRAELKEKQAEGREMDEKIESWSGLVKALVENEKK